MYDLQQKEKGVIMTGNDEQIEALWRIRTYFEELKKETRTKIRELKKETDSNFQHECRIEYLAEQITETMCDIFVLYNRLEGALLSGHHSTGYMIN